jgi:hypothetical protein
MVKRIFKLSREFNNPFHSPIPANPGLIPVVGDIYTTPPSSLNSHTGENVFPRFILPKIDLIQDDCNLGIQLDGSFGWAKIRPFQIVYRNPECILPESPPKISDLEEYRKLPSIPKNESNSWLLIENQYEYEQGKNRLDGDKTGWQEFSTTFTLIGEPKYEATFEKTGISKHNGTYARSFNWNFQITEEEHLETYLNSGWTVELNESGWNKGTVYSRTKKEIVTTSYFYASGTKTDLIKYLEKYSILDYRFVIQSYNANFYYTNVNPFPISVPGRFPGNMVLVEEGNGFYGYYYYGEGRGLSINIREQNIVIIPFQPIPEPLIIPPPPPPPMSCCPNTRANDELLRLILKKIGSADLPATVPKSLTDRSKGTTSIENLAQFTSYAVKQLDAVCGKYPIEVKIEDADLTQEGDQSRTVKIPNIAEGIAELLGLLLILKAESSATLSAAVRGMIEAGSAKQSAILAHDYAKANSEFLAYKGKQVRHQVPFAFNFNKQKLEEMLKEGTFEIKGFQNDDKDDIHDLFTPLLDMAAMYRTANFRNLGASNPGEALKSILRGYINFNSDTDETIVKPNQQKNEDEGVAKPEENWDDFLRSAEQGFIQEPGIKNNTEPYDRPFDQRPKIREIGNDTSDFED